MIISFKIGEVAEHMEFFKKISEGHSGWGIEEKKVTRLCGNIVSHASHCEAPNVQMQ